MRSTYLFAASAAITSAFAATSSESTLWVYETYTDCSTQLSGLATQTNTIVSTYCPHCTEGASPASAPTPQGPLTTYTTVYSEFCPTGLQPKTYTVTEQCSSLGAPRPSDYVPAAFVVTTATCHVCAETPVVATLTTPAPVAPSPAPAGSAPQAAPAVPTKGAAAPASPPSSGSPANPVVAGGVSQISDGQVQAPTSPASPAAPPAGPQAASPSSGGSPASPAGGAPGSGPAAGPAAKAPLNPAAAPSVAPLGTGAPIAPYSSAVPFTGSASTISVSALMVLVLMAMVGLLNLAM
ncbi:MAG: hypothetical protein Q9168_005327 [Polycauliona sp. 1 TL-2023]